MLNPSAMSSG